MWFFPRFWLCSSVRVCDWGRAEGEERGWADADWYFYSLSLLSVLVFKVSLVEVSDSWFACLCVAPSGPCQVLVPQYQYFPLPSVCRCFPNYLSYSFSPDRCYPFRFSLPFTTAISYGESPIRYVLY